MMTRLSSTTIRFTTNCITLCCTSKEGSSKAPRTLAQKALTPFEESQFGGPICPLWLDLLYSLPQHPPIVFNPVAPLSQFGQLNHLGLIGVPEGTGQTCAFLYDKSSIARQRQVS
jgi:hypothetical protein